MKLIASQHIKYDYIILGYKNSSTDVKLAPSPEVESLPMHLLLAYILHPK